MNNNIESPNLPNVANSQANTQNTLPPVPNNKQETKLVTIVVVIVGICLFVCGIIGAYFIFRPKTSDPISSQLIETIPSNGTNDPLPTEETIPNPNNIPSGEYPFKLPSDAPFTLGDIQGLYERADERLMFIYMEDKDKADKETFKATIDPYFKLFVASVQYSYEKYESIFIGDNPDLEARSNISITVYEKCTDIGTGLTEEVCKELRMIGSMSAFMNGTSFYVNLNHPEFNTDFIIDIGTHEPIHLLQYTYDIGSIGLTMPSWYKETMAVGLSYSSQEKLDVGKNDYTKHGAPKDIAQMEEYMKYKNDEIVKLEKRRAAYYIGGLFFKHIMTKVTLEEYLTLIPVSNTYRHWLTDTEFHIEFKNITGLSLDEMYEDFLLTL